MRRARFIQNERLGNMTNTPEKYEDIDPKTINMMMIMMIKSCHYGYRMKSGDFLDPLILINNQIPLTPIMEILH